MNKNNILFADLLKNILPLFCAIVFWAAGCQTAKIAAIKTSPDKRMANAVSYYEKGDYTAAMLECIELAKYDPLYPGLPELQSKIMASLNEERLKASQARNANTEKTALAEGNVLLLRDGVAIACDKITYNVKEDSGIAEFVNAYAQSWYGWGKEITRVSKTEYLIREGYITTDPYPKPGWRIEAKEIRLFPGDRVEAKNIKMYVKDTPIIFLPYYRASLKDGHSPLSVEVGYNKEWGAYALIAYDLLLKDRLHTIFRLDGRTERGFAEGIDIKGYQANGGYYESRFYKAQDQARTVTLDDSSEIEIEDDRYRVDLKCYNPLDNNWDIRYELHKFSDEDFLKEFFRKEYQRDSEPET